MNDEKIKVFDWKRIFISDELPISYLSEVAFRSVIMFLVLIIALKFLSKRGVKQLSVFELAILIALGSATGDPMFYDDIPITHGITVLLVVILLYKIITRFTSKSKVVESLLEGNPISLVKEGVIEYKNYKKVGLPYDKFFAELRLKSIDHLGQIRKAYLETSGEISVYYFDDKEVVPGLPIYPELIDKPLKKIAEGTDCACIYCGHVQVVNSKNDHCKICRLAEWILPESKKRIS